MRLFAHALLTAIALLAIPVMTSAQNPCATDGVASQSDFSVISLVWREPTQNLLDFVGEIEHTGQYPGRPTISVVGRNDQGIAVSQHIVDPYRVIQPGERWVFNYFLTNANSIVTVEARITSVQTS